MRSGSQKKKANEALETTENRWHEWKNRNGMRENHITILHWISNLCDIKRNVEIMLTMTVTVTAMVAVTVAASTVGKDRLGIIFPFLFFFQSFLSRDYFIRVRRSNKFRIPNKSILCSACHAAKKRSTLPWFASHRVPCWVSTILSQHTRRRERNSSESNWMEWKHCKRPKNGKWTELWRPPLGASWM